MNRILILCVVFTALFLIQANAQTCIWTACHLHGVAGGCPASKKTCFILFNRIDFD